MKRIVAGPRAVHEALEAGAREVALVVFDGAHAERAALKDIVARARNRGVAVEPRDAAELDALARGLRHQGVLAIGGDFPYVDLETLLARARAQGALLVALDEVTDPRNLGAIVRSAVAFGADGLLLTRDRCAPVTAAAVRASAGATEHATIARVTNLARGLEQLREAELRVVGLDAAGADDIASLPPHPRGTVLVVGSEGRGLRRLTRERCDTLARIPMAGPLASLNAASAATVAMYALTRERPNLTRSAGP